MSIIHFCGKFCSPKKTVLFAIGGAISGRYFEISPLHGAVFTTISSVAFQVAMRISWLIREKFHGKVHRNKDISNIPVLLTSYAGWACSFYLSYLAGNQALSLLGRQIAVGTAVKFSLASLGIVALSARLIRGFSEESEHCNSIP